jgi:hypothetical protein
MNYARAVEETKDVAASIGVSLSREKLQEFTECILREASARQMYDRAKEKFLRGLAARVRTQIFGPERNVDGF